jgi:dienelactone hydrolase
MITTVGCSVDASGLAVGDESGEPGGEVNARFVLEEGPPGLGSIPWPDELYRDEDGAIGIGRLPDEADGQGFLRTLRSSFSDLDGFGGVSPMYFFFNGRLRRDSIDEDSVFVIDFDTASPDSFERIPVTVHYNAGANQLALKPAPGHPLRPGHLYAAVVTRRLRGNDGAPVRPSTGFAAIRDADTPPDDPLRARAYEHYSPVIAALVDQGYRRGDIVALAVFRVQSVRTDFEEARQIIRSGEGDAVEISVLHAGSSLDDALGNPEPGAVGIDAVGGAPHDHIGWMAHGTFSSPYFLSSTSKRHGKIERNDSGLLRVKRIGLVPFTLWLPRESLLDTPAGLPLVIFQHDLQGERSEGLAVANALAGAGYAVVAVDAPFHGSRFDAPDVDRTNRFTGEGNPDGFGDVRDSRISRCYGGIGEDACGPFDLDGDGIVDFLHPFFFRDATRQGVFDLMSLVHLVQNGDWSALAALDETLSGLVFDADNVGFVGVGLGGEMGAILAAYEPAVDALVVAFGGGNVTANLVESPARSFLFDAFLDLVDRDRSEVDFDGYHPGYWPELALWQTLVEGGDPLMHAPALRGTPAAVLVTMVRDDEVVNNRTTEYLARAVGAAFVSNASMAPRYTDMESVPAPVSGNVTGGQKTTTRALFPYGEGTHESLHDGRATIRYQHPVVAPFTARSEEVVENQVAAHLQQLIRFFDSCREGVPSVVAPD